eukprot:2780944-Pyramimonas_sp.AAC.1
MGVDESLRLPITVRVAHCGEEHVHSRAAPWIRKPFVERLIIPFRSISCGHGHLWQQGRTDRIFGRWDCYGFSCTSERG